MATKKRVDSWVVTDDFWQRVEPLIPVRERPSDKAYVRQPGAGRPPKPARQVFEAIVYVLRTGCQWKARPKERFASASAIHKRFLEWEKAGLFEAIWKAGLAEYGQMEGIAWRWQSIDGAMFKAPLAQEAVGPNPTDRGKKGSKIDQVLESIVIKRKAPPKQRSKHLCADAGYRGKPAAKIIAEHGYITHVVNRRKEADNKRRDRRRRRAAGLSRFAIVGSIGSANSSCDTRSWNAASLRSTIWLLPSLRSAKYHYAQI